MAGDKVVTFDTKNWGKEVLESSIPVLVDIWAPWCSPCKMIAPIVEEFATEYEGKVKIGKLNADENASVLSQYGVMSLPTLLIFKNGKPVNSSVGFRPKRDLKRFLDESVQ